MVPLVRSTGFFVKRTLALLSMTTARPNLEHDHFVIHLNHAGASPCTDQVLDAVVQHLHLEQRLGGYAAADKVTQKLLPTVYANMANLVHATSGNEIALLESATVAWTRVFYAAAAHIARQQQQYHDQKHFILVSEAEYGANLVAACQWARTTPGWTVLAIPSEVDADGKSTGKVDLNVLEDMLQGRYRLSATSFLDPFHIAMVCVTQIPTNSGIVNPVNEIGNLLAEFNTSHQRQEQTSTSTDNEDTSSTTLSFPRIFYLVDACQAVGQVQVNVQHMQCHALVGTGRKYLRGPRGTGFLYVHQSILDANDTTSSSSSSSLLWPHHVDHSGVPVSCVPDNKNKLKSSPQPVEELLEFEPLSTASRFEFWESNLAGKLGLGVAVRQALDMGIDQIEETIRKRADQLYKLLQQMDDGRLHTYYQPECGIVTFWVSDMDSAELQAKLWDPEDGVQFEVSVVPATSTPLDSSNTAVPDLLRASVSYMTTTKEIEQFCTRLEALICNR